ncbi:MAG: amidohydrolase [Bacteroidales bacterium]|jgi:amidohydrolase|nr:amidohydrolase [Bacteroidales bacterium]
METKKYIKELASGYFDDIVQIRRHLHQYPELSKQEKNTSDFICSELDKIQGVYYTKNIGGYGICGFINGKSDNGNCVALRADMDALPICETTDLPFKSKTDGIMHACGHDVHIATLLGAIRIISQAKDLFEGRVMFIFQPSEEEYPGGAITMIKDGVFKTTKPSAVFSFHTTPEMDCGKIGLKAGNYMASTDEFYIKVIGKGGHGAMPNLNIDPIVVASNIIIALQTIVSRNAEPSLPTTLTVGNFITEGGRTNVTPQIVRLEGIIRTFDDAWRSQAHKLITQIAEKTAEAFGAKADVFIDNGYPALFNNEDVTAKTKILATEYLGDENVLDLNVRMTAEDFAYFAKEIPACYFRLGTRKQDKPITNLHSSDFDVDERSMEVGMGLEAFLGISYLNSLK